MKKFLLNNQQKIVITTSIVGTILVVIMLVQGIQQSINISQTRSALMSELSVMLYWIPLLIPALLGLFYFSKKSALKRVLTSLSFLVYFVSLSLCYFAYFTATDALEGGLLFVILGIPVSVLVSVVLVVNTFKSNNSK